MPRYYRALVLALLIALVVVSTAVSAESEGRSETRTASGGNWIIQLESDWTQFHSLNGFSSVLGDSRHHTIGSDGRTYVASFDGETQASDAIARLASHPAVEYIEPDVIYEFQEEFIPNDPGFEDQAWARTVNLPQAWAVSSGNPDVTVALVDSGVRADHPDLQGQVLEGRSYVGRNDPNVPNYDEFDTNDRIGHGTSVAGIIAAAGNNEIGIAGTSMNVQLLPMRVGMADDDTRVPSSQIAEAVEDSVNMGANVINLSLGSETQSARLEQALAYAEASDVIVVAATGNDPNRVSFPGSSPSTISVGATTIDGSDIAPFSSRLSVTDLVAPGIGVLSTFFSPESGNGYALRDGTSFSTPIVTGAAALVHSVNPDLDVHQVRALLRETAQMTFAEGTTGAGAGLLDVNAALREAMLSSFGSTWMTADEPVASLQAQRTWLWGPNAFDLRAEPYADSEHGLRLVAYYDKSRMEVTDPYQSRASEWYVTNGLLVNELISGQIQIGDHEFEVREPAVIPVAGDPESNGSPTYASFADLLDVNGGDQGDPITRTLDRDGMVGSDDHYDQYGVTEDEFIAETGHSIASVFWEYLNSTGTLRQDGQYLEGSIFNPTFFATGFPITAAYWSQVTVSGVQQDVLIQCFERRCLTYTPDNEDGWQVEMGNVGQHYYLWRYGETPEGVVAQDPSSYAMANLR